MAGFGLLLLEELLACLFAVCILNKLRLVHKLMEPLLLLLELKCRRDQPVLILWRHQQLVRRDEEPLLMRRLDRDRAGYACNPHADLVCPRVRVISVCDSEYVEVIEAFSDLP